MKEPLEGDFGKGSVKKVKGNMLKFQEQIIIQYSIKKLITSKVAGSVFGRFWLFFKEYLFLDSLTITTFVIFK